MPELQAEDRIYNNTFKGVRNLSNLNACVGNNGQPDLVEYANGFMDAALRLSELVLKDHIKNHLDEFIYPICFNARHSIEIYLKLFLNQLRLIRSDTLFLPIKPNETEQQITEADLTKTHNINTFWSWFKYNSELRDNRFVEINSKLDEYINDFGEIDPTGQTFRYPFNTESIKHLVKTPIINIANLNKRLSELKTLIDELKWLVLKLIDEYELGTYTKNLSRAQIDAISQHLPPREHWTLESFKEVKAQLKEKFNIGSKELTEALNIIQKHYEFSLNIAITLPLKALNFDTLKLFIYSWLAFHSDEERNMDLIDAVLDATLREKKFKALNEVAESLSVECKADIGAIFYLARHPEYSEYYNDVYDSEYRDAEYSQKEETSKREYIRHFLAKTNFIRNLVISLRLLGQTQLLNDLVSEFKCVAEEVRE